MVGTDLSAQAPKRSASARSTHRLMQRGPEPAAPQIPMFSATAGCGTGPSRHYLPPIPCREDLVDVAERYFNEVGLAVELGCYLGTFSAWNLERWSSRYVMVDSWRHRERSADDFDKNWRDPRVHD